MTKTSIKRFKTVRKKKPETGSNDTRVIYSTVIGKHFKAHADSILHQI